MRPRSGVFIVIAILVGLYDRWGVRAAGEEFHWNQDIGGYYNLLARGFAAGHLYLPITVNPELLAKADPYDPAVDDSLKWFDAALYHQRYYLYHGAAPAVLFFLPWRLITNHDLPENFASFVFCFGGFLFSAGALFAQLRMARKEPGPVTTALLLLALGFCTGIPFLLNRTWVYELAIGCGYFCSMAAAWCALRGIESQTRHWFAACGLACGLAVGSRPHLGIFAVAFGILILIRARRHLVPFLLPLVLCGVAIGIYNYERFGSPAEFGIRYLLTGKNQNRIKLDAANIPPSAHYLLTAKPQTSPIFPFVRLPWPPEDIPRPKEFFLEPSIGIIWLAPFLPALLLMPALGRSAIPAALLTAVAVGVFVFLAATGWSTQRYEADFLPALVLCALASAATIRNASFHAIFAVLIVAGIFVNLTIAIGGPIDEMILKRPDRYVGLSRMFTPQESYRLRLNPRIAFTCLIDVGPAGQMILALGSPIYHYELLYDGRNFISRRFGSEVKAPALSPGTVLIRYLPETQEIVVSESGEERLRHKLGALTAAPAELGAACGGRARF